MAEYSVRQDEITGKWQVKVRQNPGGQAMWFDAGDPCDTIEQANRKMDLFKADRPTVAIIKRDGVEVDRVLADATDITVWFVKNTYYSMAYAFKFNGYTVEDPDGNNLIPDELWKDYNPT